MTLVILKIWLVLLAIADLMIIVQILTRVGLFIAGKARSIDWTCYNKVMLSILAVTFLPVTAVVLYLRQ